MPSFNLGREEVKLVKRKEERMTNNMLEYKG